MYIFNIVTCDKYYLGIPTECIGANYQYFLKRALVEPLTRIVKIVGPFWSFSGPFVSIFQVKSLHSMFYDS